MGDLVAVSSQRGVRSGCKAVEAQKVASKDGVLYGSEYEGFMNACSTVCLLALLPSATAAFAEPFPASGHSIPCFGPLHPRATLAYRSPRMRIRCSLQSLCSVCGEKGGTSSQVGRKELEAAASSRVSLSPSFFHPRYARALVYGTPSAPSAVPPIYSNRRQPFRLRFEAAPCPGPSYFCSATLQSIKRRCGRLSKPTLKSFAIRAAQGKSSSRPSRGTGEFTSPSSER